ERTDHREDGTQADPGPGDGVVGADRPEALEVAVDQGIAPRLVRGNGDHRATGREVGDDGGAGLLVARVDGIGLWGRVAHSWNPSVMLGRAPGFAKGGCSRGGSVRCPV